jgi:hypothetical protein
MKAQLVQWLNFALMLDLFFVLLSFLWFVIALVGHLAHVPLGLNLWYQLWEPMMQPAIGILMAGAILSGLVSWVLKRLQPEP